MEKTTLKITLQDVEDLMDLDVRIDELALELDDIRKSLDAIIESISAEPECGNCDLPEDYGFVVL